MNEEDDWQPDFSAASILKKTLVRFSNKHVEENLKQFNSRPDTFKYDQDSEEEEVEEPENMMFETAGLRSKPTSETLYDPLKDDRCEGWTARNLTEGKHQKPLSCPGCFTPVCYSYENHAQHDGQYYSQAVRNCQINSTKVIEGDAVSTAPPTLTPAGLQQLAEEQLTALQAALSEQQNSYNVYFPVHCLECNHQLAVYDVDRKLFHLYGVV